MEKDSSKTPETPLTVALQKPEEEEIVIPDECGDSLWDKVLTQEEKKDKE